MVIWHLIYDLRKAARFKTERKLTHNLGNDVDGVDGDDGGDVGDGGRKI